ncbi:MAG: glycosyltransferase [Candidatus Paceibacterota bacterium]|jgi:glycosyltransferase involved in cell wall biosynthesis
MPKILIINTVFSQGGAAAVARNIHNDLNGISGFSSYFAYGRGSTINDGKIYKFGYLPEVYLHTFLTRFGGVEGWGTWLSTQRLINYIKQNNFDLIHIHNLHGYYVNFFWLVKFLGSLNIPIVWTLHDEWPLTWMPAHSMGCKHCVSGAGKCENAYDYPKTYNYLFQKFLLGEKQRMLGSCWNPTIVCPSEWLANRAKESYLSKFDIRVIYNGVDIKRFNNSRDKDVLRKKYGLPIDKKIIIFGMGKLKGVDHIFKIAEMLKNKNYLFLGVGGNKNYKTDLSNFIFRSYVKREQEMAELISLSDLFITPSLAETFPLFLIEAMASGLPAAGFDIPAHRELIDSRVGILARLGDVDGLSRGVEYIFDDQSRLKNMGLAAREKAELFSFDRFINGYRELYKKLLNQ